MASPAIPQLDDNTVNQQPDANSGGNEFVDGIEETALDGLDLLAGAAATKIAGNPNTVPASKQVANNNGGLLAGGGSGLLILLLLLLIIFK